MVQLIEIIFGWIFSLFSSMRESEKQVGLEMHLYILIFVTTRPGFKNKAIFIRVIKGQNRYR